MSLCTEARIRVRYAETDQMGVVYYANYLVWMEVGRVHFCKTRGFDYRDMEREDGIILAVTECNCRYVFPARFDDEVVIQTSLEDADPRMVTFRYQMSLADGGRKVASGHTRHLFLDRQLERSRLPQKYFKLFGIEA
jgi:acyl-CoA thioester hydrolase